MTLWILAVLALFVVQCFLPGASRYISSSISPSDSMKSALGPRDEVPSLPRWGERSSRALANMHEALPVFLGLALLHVATAGTPPELAVMGAAVFFFARLVYIPVYISGVMGLRSAVWTVGWVGLGMMVAALFTSAS